MGEKERKTRERELVFTGHVYLATREVVLFAKGHSHRHHQNSPFREIPKVPCP